MIRSRVRTTERPRSPGPLDTAGQTVVEFALIIPFILLVSLGTIELGRHYYVKLTMQHAVSEAARFAVTGQVLADSTGAKGMTRAESIAEIIRRRASTLSVDVDRIEIDPPDGGGPGDIVTVSAAFTFGFIAPGFRELVPNGALDFTVAASLKNEPFFPKSGGPGG